MIGSFDAAAARHVFRNNIWLARNGVCQVGEERSCHRVRTAAWFRALNDRDGFSLVKGSLGESWGGEQPVDQSDSDDNEHLQHRHSFERVVLYRGGSGPSSAIFL